jgi:hypothetical protein
MSYIHYDSMSEADESEVDLLDLPFEDDPFDGDESEYYEEQQENASRVGSVDIPKRESLAAERDSSIIGEECKFAAYRMFIRLKASRGRLFPSPAEDELLDSYMAGQTAESLTTSSTQGELDGTVFDMDWQW